MSKEVNSGGVSFFGLLAIVFITLKLTNVIAWSWWWVLSPLWGPMALIALCLILAFIVGILKYVLR